VKSARRGTARSISGLAAGRRFLRSLSQGEARSQYAARNRRPDYARAAHPTPSRCGRHHVEGTANLYAVQPDFLYSVSRDFIRNCRTPMLALPDDVPGHPLQTSIDVASLAAERRDHGVPLEGAGGVDATHDRPRAPFSKGARAR
jgi:hypothetical protein